jgi:DNA-binding transcriptional ArsR family regulator
MGATKTDQFSKRENEMAQLFKALAHPARIAIVEYLLSVDTCICGDIVDQAEIIQGSVEGTAICYCINEKTLQKMQKYFGKIESKIVQKCC